MKVTGGRIVVRALEHEEVPFCFGIPGTHNIELYDALAESETVRPVLVTDEQSASFMADGVWRASGRLACVNVVPGAGLTHALSGIAEAWMDTVPMLVLGCGIRRDETRAYQLHDVDQRALVAPVVKATLRPDGGEDLYRTVREACALARSGRPGPVFVEVPADLYLTRHGADLPDEGSPSWPEPPELDGEAVARVAERLRRARQPLVYAGLGAAGATRELRELAEALEAPVSTTFQGKGVFPESHPLFLWPGFGDAAPPFARRVAADRDLTLAVGCRFSEVGTGSWGFTPPGDLVHVDIDPEVPGRNYPAAEAVVADARTFLAALLERLREGSDGGRAPDPALRDRIREGHAEVRAGLMEGVGGPGVTPAHLLAVLQRRLGPDTIFVTDSGNGTFLAMEALRLDGPGRFLAPVDYSCMGYSVPAALGARLARPDCPVVGLVGDGALLMTGLEILTGVRERVAPLLFVLRDRELAQIAQFQETALNRKVASAVPDYALAPLAQAVGAAYLKLSSDDAVEEVVAGAEERAAEGAPVVVEVAIDYSRKTWFTRGVVRTSLGRMSPLEQARFVGRAVWRRIREGPSEAPGAGG